jgi:biofilm PGA synthesis N-glycosyltransferase PgaC
VCLDSDTVASTRDRSSMLQQFTTDRNLGAVTGRIWPVAIRTMAQLLQAIDYLAVICLVKSAECVWGGLTTVSGAWVAYRRKALDECGGWNPKTSAEDIDLSWRLQARGWRILYDAKWTARVEMLPSWRSLWLQRRRWSSGLGRTMREQFFDAFGRKARHLPVACVALLGTLWVWTVLAVLGLTTVETLSHHRPGFLIADLATASHFHWSLYSAAFLLQLIVAFWTDGGRWRQYPLMLLCAAFYPLYFWIILFTSFIAGFPKGFCQADNGRWGATAEQGDEALA